MKASPGPPTVLYLTYHGLAAPLGRAQCLPYLLRLARSGAARLRVVSFESDPLPTDELRREIRDAGIKWIELQYHGRPKGLSKLYDIGAGFLAALRLSRGVDVIHARSHVMALLALIVGRVIHRPFVFDMLGMLADEYADIGYWSRDGLFYRVTKRVEKLLLHRAGAVISCTERNARYLQATGLAPAATPVLAIPCCVDLERFRCATPGAYPRDGLAPRLVYSGGIGTWYMLDEMLAFYRVARGITPNVRFRILTRSSHDAVRAAAAHAGVDPSGLEIHAADPSDVAAFLCQSDVGLTFITPTFSKEAASPNKFAEYLACGLLVVTNAGVGDLDAALAKDAIGAVVPRFDAAAYAAAWRSVIERLGGDAVAARATTRDVARRDYSADLATETYASLYADLRGSRPG